MNEILVNISMANKKGMRNYSLLLVNPLELYRNEHMHERALKINNTKY